MKKGQCTLEDIMVFHRTLILGCPTDDDKRRIHGIVGNMESREMTLDEMAEVCARLDAANEPGTAGP